MASINLTTLFGGINPLQSSSVSPVNFRASEKIGAFNFEKLEPNEDRFSSNPLKSDFKSKSEIEQAARASSRIMQLLKENNLPLNVNMKALENLRKGHLATTRVVAAKIYSALPKEMKEGINLSNIQQAALLHDYGKVLIPKEILDKKGSFTPDEAKIMQLHSEFGYELLKQQGVNDEVLNLVKYHHQRPSGEGYPKAEKDFEYNLSLQILIAADKYSALTEDRCYHNASTKEQALDILYKDVESGVISQEVFDALKNSVY